jgi:regulator of protease activity HflC (stomatin/prohibitin superfamily)
MEPALMIYLFIGALVVLYIKFSVNIVPQSENWIVERLGRYNRTLAAGLHLIIPLVESVRYKVSVQETQLPPDPIRAITQDNVQIDVRLAILYRIVDPSKSRYRIEDLSTGIRTVIEGTVRSLIGKTDLDGVQSNRKAIASEIEFELEQVSNEWGIKLTRVEVTEVEIDQVTREAMQIQLNAERKRRGQVTTAEGDRQAAQLQADADLYTAERQAEARRVLADAEAYAVKVVADAISSGGQGAVDFEIKKIQARAVADLAVGPNVKLVVVPTDILSALTGGIEIAKSKL